MGKEKRKTLKPKQCSDLESYVKQPTERLKKDDREPMKGFTNGNREDFHVQKARKNEIAFL